MRRAQVPTLPLMAVEARPLTDAARAQIRVAVVDDNPGFRETLTSLLGTEDLVVVGTAGSGKDAVGLVRSTDRFGLRFLLRPRCRTPSTLGGPGWPAEPL